MTSRQWPFEESLTEQQVRYYFIAARIENLNAVFEDLPRKAQNKLAALSLYGERGTDTLKMCEQHFKLGTDDPSKSHSPTGLWRGLQRESLTHLFEGL